MDRKFLEYRPSLITVYNQARTVLLKEPSLVAVNTLTKRYVAAGAEALSAARQGESVMAGSPLKRGVVADFDPAAFLFRHLIRSVTTRSFLKPKMALFVPLDLTPVEVRIYKELLLSSGASEAFITEDSFINAAQHLPSSYKVIIEVSPLTIDKKLEVNKGCLLTIK